MTKFSQAGAELELPTARQRLEEIAFTRVQSKVNTSMRHVLNTPRTSIEYSWEAVKSMEEAGTWRSESGLGGSRKKTS